MLFRSVDEETAQPRSFFPGDPLRRNWVTIFRQRVSSTVEEKVWREQYPLTLAWALTHWKAQGMTLDRARVHLSDRTAGVPGIGFVACTRVRHLRHLVFEEDLPAYEHFMKARRTPAFRERRRFELKQEARASRTLRRYGNCEADVWTPEERAAAETMLKGLKTTASELRDRLRGQGRTVDLDTWLWGDAGPDFEGELAKEAEQAAAGDEAQRNLNLRVANRLLDRVRTRVVTAEERRIASELLEGTSLEACGGSEEAVRQALVQRIEDTTGSDSLQRERYRAVAE